MTARESRSLSTPFGGDLSTCGAEHTRQQKVLKNLWQASSSNMSYYTKKVHVTSFLWIFHRCIAPQDVRVFVSLYFKRMPHWDSTGSLNEALSRLSLTIIAHWNQTLRNKAAQFTTVHPDATAFVWSSHGLFNKILDDPAKYGLLEDDRLKMNGSIWYDHIHPTSKVHREIAKDMVELLKGKWKIDSE